MDELNDLGKLLDDGAPTANQATLASIVARSERHRRMRLVGTTVVALVAAVAGAGAAVAEAIVPVVAPAASRSDIAGLRPATGTTVRPGSVPARAGTNQPRPGGAAQVPLRSEAGSAPSSTVGSRSSDSTPATGPAIGVAPSTGSAGTAVTLPGGVAGGDFCIVGCPCGTVDCGGTWTHLFTRSANGVDVRAYEVAPPGAAGPSGASGSTGSGTSATGASGATGATGASGTSATGASGATGATGASGPTHATGASGPTQAHPETGAVGAAGSAAAVATTVPAEPAPSTTTSTAPNGATGSGTTGSGTTGSGPTGSTGSTVTGSTVTGTTGSTVTTAPATVPHPVSSPPIEPLCRFGGELQLELSDSGAVGTVALPVSESAVPVAGLAFEVIDRQELGDDEHSPMVVVVAHVSTDVTSVSATFGDGATDTMSPVDGWVALVDAPASSNAGTPLGVQLTAAGTSGQTVTMTLPTDDAGEPLPAQCITLPVPVPQSGGAAPLSGASAAPSSGSSPARP